MSVAQPTLEGEIKALEDEVAAYKTSQPFYNGQFTPKTITSANVYDFTFITDDFITRYDIFIEITSTNQPNQIFQPFFELFFMDNSPLTVNQTNMLCVQEAYDTNENPFIQVNITTYNVPIGTEIGVKLFYLLSANVEATLTGGIRP